MLAKIAAIVSFLCLPFSLSLWYGSHARPEFKRFDLTVYKSVSVFLKDGACAIEILNLPTRTPSRSEFRTPMTSSQWSPFKKYLSMSVDARGPYKTTSLFFPLWLPNFFLTGVIILVLLQGPGRHWWRLHRGCCTSCGYDLHGLHGRRCPECGSAYTPRPRAA